MSVGKINFTSSGNSSLAAHNWVPRHSAWHFMPSVAQSFPRNSGVVILLVEAGEPSFAKRLGQIGFFRVKRRKRSSAPNARAENRLEPLRRGLQIAHKSGRSLGAREKMIEPPQSFVDALDRGRIRKPQISRRAKRIAGHERHARFVEQQLRQFRRIFR